MHDPIILWYGVGLGIVLASLVGVAVWSWLKG